MDILILRQHAIIPPSYPAADPPVPIPSFKHSILQSAVAHEAWNLLSLRSETPNIAISTLPRPRRSTVPPTTKALAGDGRCQPHSPIPPDEDRRILETHRILGQGDRILEFSETFTEYFIVKGTFLP